MIVQDECDKASLLSLYLARSGFDTISFTQPLLTARSLQKYSDILLDTFGFVYG